MVSMDSEPPGTLSRLYTRRTSKVAAVVMAAALLSAGWMTILGVNGEDSFKQVGLSGAKAATGEAAGPVRNGLSGSFGADDSGVGRSVLSAPAVGHRFDTLTTTEGVSIERTWHLDVSARTLMSSTVVTNQRSETIDLTHRELMPVAPSPWPVGDVVFGQTPDLIETDESGTHLATFSVPRFAPGASLTIDYVTSVPESVELDNLDGTFAAVLVGWADELRARELALFAVSLDGSHDVGVNADGEVASVPADHEGLNSDLAIPTTVETQANDVSSTVSVSREAVQPASSVLVGSSPPVTTSKPAKSEPPSTKTTTSSRAVQSTTGLSPWNSSSNVTTAKSTEPASAPKQQIPPAGPKRVPNQVHPSTKSAGKTSWSVTYSRSSPGTYQAQVYYQFGRCTAALWHGPDGQRRESRGWSNPKSNCSTSHKQVFGGLSGSTRYTVAIEVVDGHGTSTKATHSFTTPS